MKSLIATLVLLSLTISISVLNRHYITSLTSELHCRLDALPPVTEDDCLTQAQELLEYWKARENTVALSVSLTFIDRIGEQAARLCACAEYQDTYGFATALALLRDAITNLDRGERFSVGNLL